MSDSTCQAQVVSAPAEIYEPWGGSYRVPWIGWLAMIATVALAYGLLAPVAGFLAAVAWLAYAIVCQIFLLAFRRYRTRTFLQGKPLTATVCRKRIAGRGGYPIVTVEFDWEGHRQQSSAAVGMKTYLYCEAGKPMRIRVRSASILGIATRLAWVAETGARQD